MVGAMAPRAVRAVADAGRRGLPKAKLSPIFRSRGRLGCPVGFREKWRHTWRVEGHIDFTVIEQGTDVFANLIWPQLKGI